MKIILLLGLLKYGSRKEIKEMIKKGLIKVNGNIITSEKVFVTDNDEIRINDEVIFHKEHVYLIMNKPKGYLSANKDSKDKTVIDLIDEPYSRYNLSLCGRLDKDTTGLLLLTSDGKLVHKVISPKKNVYKKYYVTLDKAVNDYKPLLEGVEILDGENKPYTTYPAIIEEVDETHLYISIKEGKFHQVKRMFKYIGNEVVELHRVSIGELGLGDLKLGEYQEISLAYLEEKLNLN